MSNMSIQLMRLKWNRYSIYGVLFVLPAVVYFLLVFFYPLFLAFWNSLHQVQLITRTQTWVGFAKYERVLTSPDFWSSARITLNYVLLTTPPVVAVSLVFATIITGLRRRSFVVFSTVFFLPFVTSVVSAGMIWRSVLDPTFGIVNTILRALDLPADILWFRSPDTALISVAIVSIWLRMGFDVMLFVSGLLGISDSYYEAAHMEGASARQKFIYVTLPFLNPQIVMVLTLELIFSFKVFGTINVTTAGGPGGATKTLLIYMMRELFHLDYGAASALTVIMLVFLLSISLLQRLLLRRVVEH